MRGLIPRRLYTRIPFWVIPLVVGLVVLALPYLGTGPAVLRIIVSISLLSLIVVGLNTSFGFAGELALAQSVMYAVGAYVTGYFAVQGLDLSVNLVLAIFAAAIVGLVTGIPGTRVASWSLAMLTFFLVLLIPDITQLLPQFTGGAAGLSGIPLPTLFGQDLGDSGYYTLVVIITIIVFALFRNFLFSRRGRALLIMKNSPVLAQSIGISVSRTKLSAYVLGALPAGIAGCLFAYQDGYVSSVSFGFSAAVAILAASILGGSASVYGAVLGAAIMTIGPLQSTVFQDYSLLVLGAILVLGGLFLRGGVAGLLTQLIRRRVIGDDLLPDVVAAAAGGVGELPRVEGARLRIAAVSKSFGGNRALTEVSLEATPGRVVGLIGPNGSGKTTLLNIVSGFLRPTSGSVELGDRHLSRLSPNRVALTGVSRTFQTPQIPKGMSVVEVVSSARINRQRVSIAETMLRLPRYWRRVREDRAEALRILAQLGIVELADREASDLALGTTRLVEVARALAGSPSLVLLDEPASGLDENEVQVLAELIRRLGASGTTVILVEHNFEMVMSVVDEVHVLHLGKVIASGAPDTVRNDPQVVESYLGAAARERMERAQSKTEGTR
jgi:branched-chain amino acid transport system permease protein